VAGANTISAACQDFVLEVLRTEEAPISSTSWEVGDMLLGSMGCPVALQPAAAAGKCEAGAFSPSLLACTACRHGWCLLRWSKERNAL